MKWFYRVSMIIVSIPMCFSLSGCSIIPVAYSSTNHPKHAPVTPPPSKPSPITSVTKHSISFHATIKSHSDFYIGQIACQGTIGIGGTFGAAYFLKLVNTKTNQSWSSLEDLGSYSPDRNTWTVSSGTYKVYIYNSGFYALDAKGTLTF